MLCVDSQLLTVMQMTYSSRFGSFSEWKCTWYNCGEVIKQAYRTCARSNLETFSIFQQKRMPCQIWVFKVSTHISISILLIRVEHFPFTCEHGWFFPTVIEHKTRSTFTDSNFSNDSKMWVWTKTLANALCPLSSSPLGLLLRCRPAPILWEQVYEVYW